jgi:hypothetical protein
VRIEEELFDVADGYRPLIAVGKPGGSKEIQGGLAYRTFLEHADWKDYVADKIRRAEKIVVVVKDSEGVRWELARILREGAARKTLFSTIPRSAHRRIGTASRRCGCRSWTRRGSRLPASTSHRGLSASTSTTRR